MSLSELHEVLEWANPSPLRSIQCSGMSLYHRRRFGKEGLQSAARLGAHVQIVHGCQGGPLMGEKEDVLGSHFGQ